ncbi:unnamed protein product [Parajaminaea phylloscopi]
MLSTGQASSSLHGLADPTASASPTSCPSYKPNSVSGSQSSPHWTSLPDPADQSQRRKATQWADIVRGQLDTFLTYSGENTDTMQALRQFCQDRLFAPHALGPAPSLDTATGQPSVPWKSFVADDASPAEFSLAISDVYVKTRLVFEPTPLYRRASGGAAGQGEMDSVNALAPLLWAARNEQLNEHVDFQWLNKLAAQLVLPASEASQHPNAQQLTQIAYGVEMVKELPVLKAYFGIDAISRAKGLAKDVLLQRSLSSLGFSHGWSLIKAYLDHVNAGSSPDDPLARPEFVGFDCVDPSKSRMKVYVRFRSIADARDLVRHLDMGGQSDRASFTEQSKWALALWNHLCATQTPSVGCSELEDQEERVRGALVYYELTMDNQIPRAKFYLPVRHFFKTDRELALCLDDFLSEHNLRPRGWYHHLCEKLSSHRSLDSRSGLQTIVGCAHKKGRLELTVYFATEMYAPERWTAAPF